jgi:hypothetical protein
MSIDNNYQMPKRERGQSDQKFEPLPQDIYQAQILKVELKKGQKKFNSEETEDIFAFTFVVVDGKFIKRRLWQDCRMIMNPAWEGGSASWLYKIFSSANKVELTSEECDQIGTKQINELEGKQVRLLVKQKPKADGSIKNVIDSILTVNEDIPYNPTKTSTFTKPKEGEEKKDMFEEMVEEDEKRASTFRAPEEEQVDASDIGVDF